MSEAARLGIVILAVADLPRARAFYGAVFGWVADVDTPVYVEFRLPAGMRLGLYARDAFARNVFARNVGEGPSPVRPRAIAATELYLFPGDLEAAVERAIGAGGRPLSALARRDWGDDVAYVSDPDGNVIALARPPVD